VVEISQVKRVATITIEIGKKNKKKVQGRLAEDVLQQLPKIIG